MNVLTPAVKAAADRLEHRAQVARQILEDLGRIDLVIPSEKFNDDDWYEYTSSMEFVRNWGTGWSEFRKPPVAADNLVGKGMTVKCFGIWRLA